MGEQILETRSPFPRKGDVNVQVRKDKRLVQMISMIRDATIVNIGRKERKTNMEIKKSDTVVQYTKFMKDVYRADQYLIYYLVLRKTKIFKKGGTVSAKLCTRQCIFCLYDTKYKQKILYPLFNKNQWPKIF